MSLASKLKAGSLPPSGEKRNELEDSQRISHSTTVTKAMGIVEMLAGSGQAGVGLGELSALTGMPKSSIHRYMATLQSVGLAERDDSDRYRLGTQIIELAGMYLAKSDLRSESQTILTELADLTGETIHLAVPSGVGVVYIAKIESKFALGMSSHIGARLPLHCSSLGKAILAYSSPDLLQAVLAGHLDARTANTITSGETLVSELAAVRSQGYALDIEENEMGICCVGAPVLDHSGVSIGAISISGPRERISRERANQLGLLLRERVLHVSRRRGYAGQYFGVPEANTGR